jgi:hypothetical protein
MWVNCDSNVVALTFGNMRRAKVVWDGVNRARCALGIVFHGFAASDPAIGHEPRCHLVVRLMNDVAVDSGRRWRPPIHKQAPIDG